jgi:hypothetical protein
VVDLCRKSTSLEENTRVTTNTSKKSSTTFISSSARAATKHLMSVKQSHTALQPTSLKVGIDIQLRNVGSILGRMAYSTISHPQFENSSPSLIALSDPLAVATLRRPLGLDF